MDDSVATTRCKRCAGYRTPAAKGQIQVLAADDDQGTMTYTVIMSQLSA